MGGLISSIRDCKALTALKSEMVRPKKDERISGDNYFEEADLKEADEQVERHYWLAAEGFDIGRVAEHVA